MLNISIIEFIVYGIFAYSSLIVLVLSIKSPPQGRTTNTTMVRAMYMIPGIICSLLLAGSGVDIFIDSGSTEIIEVYNGTDDSLITNSTKTITPASIELQNPVWIMLHWLFAVILMLYVIIQILQMFYSRD